MENNSEKREREDDGLPLVDDNLVNKRLKLIEQLNDANEVKSMYQMKQSNSTKYTGVIVEEPFVGNGFHIVNLVVFKKSNCAEGDEGEAISIPHSETEKQIEQLKVFADENGELKKLDNLCLDMGSTLSLVVNNFQKSRNPTAGDLVDIFDLKYSIRFTEKKNIQYGWNYDLNEKDMSNIMRGEGCPFVGLQGKAVLKPRVTVPELIETIGNLNFGEVDKLTDFKGEEYTYDVEGEVQQENGRYSPYAYPIETLYAKSFPKTFAIFYLNNGKDDVWCDESKYLHQIQSLPLDGEDNFVYTKDNVEKRILRTGKNPLICRSANVNSPCFNEIRLNCYKEDGLKNFLMMDPKGWAKFMPTVLSSLKAVVIAQVNVPQTISLTMRNENEAYTGVYSAKPNFLVDWKNTLSGCSFPVSRSKALYTVFHNQNIDGEEVPENVKFITLQSDFSAMNEAFQIYRNGATRNFLDCLCLNEFDYNASKFPEKKWDFFAVPAADRLLEDTGSIEGNDEQIGDGKNENVYFFSTRKE